MVAQAEGRGGGNDVLKETSTPRLETPGVQSSHYIHLYRIKQSLKKTELLDQVVKKTGVTKVMADKVLSAVTDSIAESLADGKKGKCEEGKKGKSTERLCDEREGIKGSICIRWSSLFLARE